MTTIKGYMDGLPDRLTEMAKAAVYNKMGPELTQEIKNSTCELIVDLKAGTTKFENCPPELDEKIRLRYLEINNQ